MKRFTSAESLRTNSRGGLTAKMKKTAETAEQKSLNILINPGSYTT
jgi:3-dehydroquinate dehydratase